MSAGKGRKRANKDEEPSPGQSTSSYTDPDLRKGKIFNDPIHGHFLLPEICVLIIDTPQFQRLRHIIQQGGCYQVYPGASHNRFEHSIGVCHLAGTLVKKLQSDQPDLIDKKDVLCVQIAGLCHDLGHGPLSHAFDEEYMKSKKIRELRTPSNTPQVEDKWEHEDASIKMFYHLLSSNLKVDEMFQQLGLSTVDKLFIEEQISGKEPREGRKDKPFLYEIVANKRNSIDVDKWDYFARDCHHLGLKNSFDHKRFMHFCRVLRGDDGKLQICFRDKEALKVYNLFQVRWQLHKVACHHKTTKIIEKMYADVLILANEYSLRTIKEGKSFDTKLYDAVNVMEAYTKLNDNIFQQIRHSKDPKMDKAKDLLDDIDHRRLYKFIDEAPAKEEESVQTSLAILIAAADVHVHVAKYDFGKGGEDFLKQVRFYRKNNPDTAIPLSIEDVSGMLPQKFSEQKIFVYCTSKIPAKIQAAEECFKKFCAETGYQLRSRVTDGSETRANSRSKLFNDPIHGSMLLPAVCVTIIDTPEFQRLRHIKQLGGCYHVYPGASHNRFEHSLGVCYLAGEFLKHLNENQKDETNAKLVSESDILCVQVAGLCHELGQGPLSKVFENDFMPPSWKRQEVSVAMFHYIIECNKHIPLSLEQITFISELINPPELGDRLGKGLRAFLYNIVANKEDGIDVDKWDYLARDCYHLGIPNSFDYRRMMYFAHIHVETKTNDTQIRWRHQEAETLNGMFNLRKRLHQVAYQHKTSQIIEFMYSEVLQLANKHLAELIDWERADKAYREKLCRENSDGSEAKQRVISKDITISGVANKEDGRWAMQIYSLLNDGIFQLIANSETKEMEKAREILEMIEKRQQYKFVHSAIKKKKVPTATLR